MAARAAAAELAAAEAALAKQAALSAVLAMPRVPWALERASGAPEEPALGSPKRTAEEQRTACEALARPREREEPAPPTPTGADGVVRTASEQRRRCAELAQAKQRLDMWKDDDDPAFAHGHWREMLIARASQPASEDVEEARLQLKQMIRRHVEQSRGAEGSHCVTRPGSARRRASAGTSPKQAGDEPPVDLQELRSVVEELLWVILLQWRSCPASRSAAPGAGGAASTGGSMARGDMEERLGTLLIDSVGPTLRPFARKVLAPGTRLARQCRSQFPRLAAHLGFRESEDLGLAQSTWTAEEVEAHAAEVRACRDRVLSSDLTKVLANFTQ